MHTTNHDRRVQATLRWIVESFNGLVKRRRYSEIRVNDIIAGAGVGRSTFYEHFRSKDEVFARSLLHVMVPLADSVDDTADDAVLARVVEHFWEVRPMARNLMAGPSGPVITRVLTDLVQERLEKRASERGSRTVVPVRVAAAQIAHSQLAFVRTWLESEGPSPMEAAAALRATTHALVAALAPLGEKR